MNINIEIEYIKRIECENEQLKEKVYNLRQDLQNRCDRCIELNDKNEELKEDNKILIEIKNIWLDSHRKLAQEKDKLSDELTLNIGHNHIQTLEINELEQELKEYRGF